MNKEKSKNHKKNENFKTLDQELKNLHWYTEIEDGYLEGVDSAEIYKAEMCYKSKCYEITVYTMKLISKNLSGWDYKIYTLKNDEIIDEYDAGVDTYDHFSTPEETKKASILTLQEILEE